MRRRSARCGSAPSGSAPTPPQAELRETPTAGAYRPISVRDADKSALCAVASRSHADPATEEFLEKLGVTSRRSAGSSLKFCLVAEGEADVYPRLAPTMEWDTAAGHAVLAAAGGAVLKPDGSAFGYGKCEAGFKNGPFVAWGARGVTQPTLAKSVQLPPTTFGQLVSATRASRRRRARLRCGTDRAARPSP